MRRPWQVWSLYFVCLAALAPAMAWVTYRAVELDAAEFHARLVAQQEQEVSKALWIIDAQRLTPLLAEEAARPDFVFQPKGAEPANAIAMAEYGLTAPPPFVLLNYELSAKTASSPQVACDADKNTEPDELSQRLAKLHRDVKYDELLAKLPEQTLPQLTLLAQNAESNSLLTPVVVSNTANLDNTLAQAARPSGPGTADDAQGQQLNNGRSQTDVPSYQRAGTARNSRRGQNNSYEPLQQQLVENQAADLQERDAAYQNFTQRKIAQQRTFEQTLTSGRVPHTIREGISQPIWVGDKLLFARRVQRGAETVIQGCWIDWTKLRADLLAQIASILPNADLQPDTVQSGDIDSDLDGRPLATLPVRLIVAAPEGVAPAWSPIRIALAATWVCLGFVAAASAWMLQGVVTLSERRAAFVSAVTHELRTPLTTFRMYAEMLSSGMVKSPEQQQKYLDTLRIESDRLTHLVENVLLYARLERGSPGKNRIDLSLTEMLERIEPRLHDRAEQAEMKLEVIFHEKCESTLICTDPAAVEQILFNLVDNACKYASSGKDARIVLDVMQAADHVRLEVSDFGPGLSPAMRKRLFQPFSKSAEEAASSAPGVGLGLALCKRLAQDLGGKLELVPCTLGARFALKLSR